MGKYIYCIYALQISVLIKLKIITNLKLPVYLSGNTCSKKATLLMHNNLCLFIFIIA